MEVQYDAQGRMKYHPDYHSNHKKQYATKELSNICKYYGFRKVKVIVLSLGRTKITIRLLVNVLRKNGTFEKYKSMRD
ncbi:hypothetical protein [Bacillus cereus]|uniref:hypothetical protein n=1 Tax=Bacillus cereus TaxID=1396 RepID=UPI0005CE4113